MIKNKEQFEKHARAMIKYLCENYPSHVTVIITPTSAELLENCYSISASQTAEMKMAREGRLFLKQKRVEVEKVRKELKEQSHE